MLKKILFFRTDRIGDLIINCPSIITIKNNFQNTEVSLVCSNKNIAYAKSLNIFDHVYNFPKNNLIKKFNFIKMLSKKEFDYIFIFDGKDRSIFSSIFIKSNYKIAFVPKKKFSFLYKITKIKYVNNDEKSNLNNLYQNILELSGIKKKITNYDFLTNKKDNNFSLNLKTKNFILLHLDEKWIRNLYIKKYENVEPTYEEFIDFINKISKNDDLVITTGLINFNLIDNLKKKFFQKINNILYIKNYGDKTIYLIFQPTFEDLESLLRNSKVLISCHGAIIHAASSLNIKVIDLIDGKYKNWYQRYTSYIKNYNFVYRYKFSAIKNEIINKIY